MGLISVRLLRKDAGFIGKQDEGCAVEMWHDDDARGKFTEAVRRLSISGCAWMTRDLVYNEICFGINQRTR